MGLKFAVGGLEKCSFIDFPGALSAVVFTRGCNLRCGYCHNPALISCEPGAAAGAGGGGGGADAFLDAEAVLRFLAARRGLLGGVVVTGGEPTLQPDLDGFIERVRALGFCVKLDTNGTRPEVLAGLLARGRLDYVALDYKDLPEDYAALTAMREPPRVLGESLALLRQGGVPFELRTTVVWPHHGEARLRQMAGALRPGERWFLQRFRPGQVLDAAAPFQVPDEGELGRIAQALAREFSLGCAVR